ncbi:MAG: hypothetical protein ACOCWI_00045 [Bacillota bacterium]
MNKVKRKLSCYRRMKTISYLIGFPLLIAMVFVCSLAFIGESAFENTWWYGLAAVIALWIVVTLFQIVFSFFAKGQKARTMFALIVAVGLVLASAILVDAYMGQKFEELEEDNQEYDVTIENYEYQVNWFSTLTSDKTSMTTEFNDKVADFMNMYNISFKSENYGSQNTDLSEVEYSEEDDAYYSPNGMFADGYIFGMQQALDILITYHETQEHYKAEGKDADEELQGAIAALENNPLSDWSQYKQTDEYQDAYGVDGEAYKYMLSLDRLNAILSTLGRELEDDVAGLPAALNLIGMSEFVPLLGYINENLDVDTIVTIINDMELFEEPITSDDLMELLKGFSFYQSPKTTPIFEFIENDTLREYAYADYYATVHGAKIGSVLIGSQIGNVDMENTGFPAEMGYSLDELYQLRADLSYKPQFYPLFAARRYLYVFAGIIGLSAVLAYHFAEKEKELFATLTMEGK